MKKTTACIVALFITFAIIAGHAEAWFEWTWSRYQVLREGGFLGMGGDPVYVRWQVANGQFLGYLSGTPGDIQSYCDGYLKTDRAIKGVPAYSCIPAED